MTHTHCSKLNHDDDHYFILHPERHHVLENIKSQDCRVGTKIKDFGLLDQMSDSREISHGNTYSYAPYIYIFGASREMVVVVVTYNQILTKVVTPSVDE